MTFIRIKPYAFLSLCANTYIDTICVQLVKSAYRKYKKLKKFIFSNTQKIFFFTMLVKQYVYIFVYRSDDNCYYEKIGKNDPVKLEDLPFDIPDSWTWIRQKNICWLDNGKKFNGITLPYLEAKVIRGKAVPTYQNSGVIVGPEHKVILVDGENSGEIMTPPFEGYMGSTFKIFSAVKNFNYQFLLFIFLLNKEKYKNSKIGAAIPHLNKEIFKESYIAVPPMNEQTRIVNKINSFEPLIAKYSLTEEKLTKLEEEFPEKFKKSILKYAIEGKLVKQDPNDEPASVLLERIRTEKEKLIKEGKIKRDKNESYIYQGDDKNYYEKICLQWPSNWVALPLKSVLIPMQSCKPQGEYFRYIDIDAVDNKNQVISNPKIMRTKNAPSRASRKLHTGDVIFSIVRPYLKNIALISENYSDCIGSTGFYVCSPLSELNSSFLYYFLLSPYCIDGIMPFMKGDNSPSIRGEDLEKLIIGLPSNNEQDKIIQKLESIIALI